MHGTGQFSALIAMNLGGSVVDAAVDRKFDAAELWREVERHGATSIVIVGDAFARPMLEALDANPGRWDLSSRASLISSSGVMWSHENKEGLLAPPAAACILFDSLRLVGGGRPGRLGLGAQGPTSETAEFMLGPNASRCSPRTAAASSPAPASAAWSASAASSRSATTRTRRSRRRPSGSFEGKRWIVPGDWAEVDADGTLHLLGRGSVCINTGGEKVFPEEVEEALKTHPGVRDAVVVGVPDERFGEVICAVVEPRRRGDADAGRALRAREGDARRATRRRATWCSSTPSAGAPNGKVDYKASRSSRSSASAK